MQEGLAAQEDAYEQVPESSGESGRGGSSLSRCLAQAQHCAHPQCDGRETPEQTAVERGLLASGHQMTQSGRWTQEGVVSKSPWLEGSSCAGGGLGSPPGSRGALHWGSTPEAGRTRSHVCCRDVRVMRTQHVPARTRKTRTQGPHGGSHLVEAGCLQDPGEPTGVPTSGGGWAK